MSNKYISVFRNENIYIFLSQFDIYIYLYSGIRINIFLYPVFMIYIYLFSVIDICLYLYSGIMIFKYPRIFYIFLYPVISEVFI